MTYPKMHRYEPEPEPPEPLPISSAPGRIDDRRPHRSDLDPIEEATWALDRVEDKLRELSSLADEDLEAIPFPIDSNDDGPFAA